MATTWTKKEFDSMVSEHYKQMKSLGFSKPQCVKDVKRLMKQNSITIKNK